MIERLTERETCTHVTLTGRANECDNPFYAVLEKLAAYEDTGLTPDEIKHVKHTNAIRKELLAKAMKSIDYLDKELSKRLEHEKDMLRLDMVMKSIALEIDESEDSF